MSKTLGVPSSEKVEQTWTGQFDIASSGSTLGDFLEGERGAGVLFAISDAQKIYFRSLETEMSPVVLQPADIEALEPVTPGQQVGVPAQFSSAVLLQTTRGAFGCRLTPADSAKLSQFRRQVA